MSWKFIGSPLMIMASTVWILWLGVVLGSCYAGPRCPTPCLCRPATLTCQGCPKDYLVLSNDTQLLSVNGCKNIQYLLKLHSSHLENEQIKYSLHKLEITDSSIDKIPESYISNIYPIQSLNFSNNLIEVIEPGLEANSLTHFDLSHNRLSFIGNRTFYNMKNMLYLDMSSNLISNLSVGSFVGLEKLAHLDISKNNLTFLIETLFAPVISLQQLNLSYNMLEMLSEKCFGNLMLLQQLDISYNRLTNVAPGTLQLLPNLAKLLLADNPQLKPDAQIFVGTGRRLQQVDASRTGLVRVPEALTHSVRYLSLAGNKISALRCGDLDGYPLLHMLDFSDNIIEYIEDDALGRLEMISSLHLVKNKLQTVPKMLPDKLIYLSMDQNMIRNLTIMDFTTLTNLKELFLSNNLIAYIQENTFTQLISLEVLDISNNPLQALSPNTFGGPLSLKVLKICNISLSPPAKDISFPVPFPEGIEQLYLKYSPGLMREFLADTAALAAMTRLQYLDMSYTNTTNIRSDLLHFLPEIKHLKLEGNTINCTELNWLAEWMKENKEEYDTIFCSVPKLIAGKRIIDLPPPPKPSTQAPTAENGKTITGSLNQATDRKFYQKINVDSTKKISLSNMPKDMKNLLDLQSNEYGSNFKSLKHDLKLEKENNNSAFEDSAESLASLFNYKSPIPDMSQIKNGNRVKKINNNLATKAISVKTSNNKNKLIEIFSQLSQIEHNSLNVTNKMEKINSMADVSVPLCNASGNSNDTENKTCSLHPSQAQQKSQIQENNMNIEHLSSINGKNLYGKMSDDSKVKKWKYVSFPKEYITTSSKLKTVREVNKANSSELVQIFLNKSRPLYDDNLAGNKRNKNIEDDLRLNTREASASKKYYSDDKTIYVRDILTSFLNATNQRSISNTSTKADFSLESIENVSQHQTLEFKAEESTAGSLVGVGLLVAVLIGGSAIVTAIFISRRRKRITRQRGPDMMEVQTISAVGELW